MTPAETAQQLAQGGKVHEVGSSGRLFRIIPPTGPVLLKVYESPGHHRRERRALDTLSSIPGLPAVVDRSEEAENPWVTFEDSGGWDLKSLPGNVSGPRRAGEILAGLHASDPSALTNLIGGIDEAWVDSDYPATFARLERYRRRLPISKDLVEAAQAASPPRAGEPRASHTNPRPEKFLMSDDGDLVLMDWEWATLAPPEWDFSLAYWAFLNELGNEAAEELASGYGRTLVDDELDRWVAYHIGMTLLNEAETKDGRLDYLAPLVEQLEVLVGG